jgi:hypothetical protein
MHLWYGSAIEKNCLEHISLMAQEQIELEFREELQQLAQMQQMMQNSPRKSAITTTNYVLTTKN